jgi:hypothetical protein
MLRPYLPPGPTAGFAIGLQLAVADFDQNSLVVVLKQKLAL